MIKLAGGKLSFGHLTTTAASGPSRVPRGISLAATRITVDGTSGTGVGCEEAGDTTGVCCPNIKTTTATSRSMTPSKISVRLRFITSSPSEKYEIQN